MAHEKDNNSDEQDSVTLISDPFGIRTGEIAAAQMIEDADINFD